MTSAPVPLRYPDFLCIGAQKSGTSWLDANLRRHPRIWMPWIKEIQYFNDIHIPSHRAWTGRHRIAHAGRAARRLFRQAGEKPLDLPALERIAAIANGPLSDEWYGRIFAHARPRQLCGEVTPEYSLLPDAGIVHLHRLNPAAKIIFLMRDPVDRCWSHLRMLARDRPDLDLLAAAGAEDVLARADYPAILARWSRIFPAAQIFTARLPEIAAAPEEFMRALLRFLRLPPHPAALAKLGEKVFVGEDAPMPEPVRALLEARLAPARDWLAARRPAWP